MIIVGEIKMIKEELFTLSFPYYTGRNRKVRVYVPEHEEAERLPVIYMTDGQNLFEDNNPGQFGCWYTREAISEVGKAIIVGIHNDESPLQRARELTTKSIGALRFPDAMPESIRNSIVPEGELFDNFAVNTVIPEIEKRFPVQKGRNAAAFCGSSSGGLQAYFTALSHPDEFCMSGVFSPVFSILYAEDVIRWTKETVGENKPYLYIYSGANGRMEQEICESTKAVVEAISEFYPKEKLKAKILPEQPHHESAWEPVFKDFLHTFLTRREKL